MKSGILAKVQMVCYFCSSSRFAVSSSSLNFVIVSLSFVFSLVSSICLVSVFIMNSLRRSRLLCCSFCNLCKLSVGGFFSTVALFGRSSLFLISSMCC